MNLVIAATILAGLPLDQHWARHGQVAVSIAAWAVCAMLWMRSAPHARRALAACLAIATLGEVFLSLGWGVYRYRLGNIPLFVPPGHVLLFFLGTQIARRLPARGEWAVALLALPVVALFAWSGRDTLGPLLYAFFLVCLWLSPSRRLYATMFVLSLLMELYGTWLGNWAWSPDVPWLGLTAANPPLAAGAFIACSTPARRPGGVGIWRSVRYRESRPALRPSTLTPARHRASDAGEAGVEAERGFAPRGDAQRVLVTAVAADHLEAERQPARAAARRNADRGQSRLRP